MVDLSKENLNKGYQEQLENGDIQVHLGDGRLGFEPNGPYDAIHVGASIPEIPQSLKD